MLGVSFHPFPSFLPSSLHSVLSSVHQVILEDLKMLGVSFHPNLFSSLHSVNQSQKILGVPFHLSLHSSLFLFIPFSLLSIR